MHTHRFGSMFHEILEELIEEWSERYNLKDCPKCEDGKLEHEMTLTVGDIEEDEDLEYYVCQNCETRIVNP